MKTMIKSKTINIDSVKPAYIFNQSQNHIIFYSKFNGLNVKSSKKHL